MTSFGGLLSRFSAGLCPLLPAPEGRFRRAVLLRGVSCCRRCRRALFLDALLCAALCCYRQTFIFSILFCYALSPASCHFIRTAAPQYCRSAVCMCHMNPSCCAVRPRTVVPYESNSSCRMTSNPRTVRPRIVAPYEPEPSCRMTMTPPRLPYDPASPGAAAVPSQCGRCGWSEGCEAAHRKGHYTPPTTSDR